MKKKILGLVLLVVILFLPHLAHSQTNLLTNGSFETGGFNGWTTTNTQGTQGCSTWAVLTANNTRCYGNFNSPQDGSFGVLIGFDGSGGEMTLYQDVTPSPLQSTRLTFTYRTHVHIPNMANTPRTFNVQVRDTSNNVLDTLLTSTIIGSNQDSGWQTEQISLNQFYNQTIRITFHLIVPQSFTGPGQFELDNVILESFGPTSANVEIGGQVTNAKGYGIGNALITFTDSNGDKRIARTNPFGFYSFNDVEVGNTYLLEVHHKQYEFSDNIQIVNLDNARRDINFISDGFRVRGNRIQKRE